jgi:hypothetical protein
MTLMTLMTLTLGPHSSCGSKPQDEYPNFNNFNDP